MNAGRELDALVAEKVMDGVSRYPIGISFWIEDVPNYSTSIEAGWKVVEKMEQDGYEVEVIYSPSNGWSVTFEKGEQFGGSPRDDLSPLAVPLAICLAALRAVTSPHRSTPGA